ncbi:hypothetical protein BI347_21445 [Chromobacterium sphagni]|uniref:Uncharacterized protein n=1 Tax=Chromobacterium sphagni TaxID=1903179 RepID=A0A1S1WTP0_9NEIS|nr:hypothetical protein BI347_21445 [Chromobacterium sphagni]
MVRPHHHHRANAFMVGLGRQRNALGLEDGANRLAPAHADHAVELAFHRHGFYIGLHRLEAHRLQRGGAGVDGGGSLHALIGFVLDLGQGLLFGRGEVHRHLLGAKLEQPTAAVAGDPLVGIRSGAGGKACDDQQRRQRKAEPGGLGTSYGCLRPSPAERRWGGVDRLQQQSLGLLAAAQDQRAAAQFGDEGGQFGLHLAGLGAVAHGQPAAGA